MSKPRPNTEVIAIHLPAAPAKAETAPAQVEAVEVPAPVKAEPIAPAPAVAVPEETAAAVATEEQPVAPVEAETVVEEKPAEPDAVAEPPKTSAQLKQIREEVVANHTNLLANIDQQIQDAKSRETEEHFNNIVKEFVPTLDKSLLRGRDIVFLVQRTKSMGNSEMSKPLGASLHTASEIFWALKGAEGVTIAAKFWGDSSTLSSAKIDGMEMATYDTSRAPARDFVTATQQVAKEQAAKKVSSDPDRMTHYIVIGDGDIGNDSDNILRKLAVSALIDASYSSSSKATVDFVIVNPAEKTEMGALLSELSNAPKRLNIAQVADAAGVRGAVMGVLKARVADVSYVPPAPVVETPAETVAETTVPAAEEKPAAVVKEPGVVSRAFNRILGRGKKETPAPAAVVPAAAPQPGP